MKPVKITANGWEGYWEKLCRVYVQQISNKDAQIAEYEDRLADLHGEIELLRDELRAEKEFGMHYHTEFMRLFNKETK